MEKIATKTGLLEALHDYIEGIRLAYINEYDKNKVELPSKDIIHNALIDCQNVIIIALDKL